MALFFGVFAAAGSAAFYFVTWLPLSGILAAQSWNERECVVLSSRVEKNHSSDGTTYRVDIRYRYEADWGTYEGDRYDFSVGSSSGYAAKAKVVDAYPPGTETICWVDPDDPTRSVINRSPGSFLWWTFFPIPFLMVGFGGLLAVVFGSRWRQPEGSKSGRRRQRTAKKFVSEPAPAGALELEPEASRAAKIFGTLFMAVLWNGLLGVVLFRDVVSGILSGDIDWLETLFSIPFALAGLAMIGFFLYQLLASFNPVPHLTLASGHLVPGGATVLSWRITGRADRLAKLTIELEGRETVRYRRGTSTYTDHHTFFSEELVSEGSIHSLHRGQISLQVPERTVPSFEAPNNKIEWRLKVRGEIRYWPDVIEDFAVTVYPS